MNRGTVKKIVWERRGLQKGRLKKVTGKGPNRITFFHSYCDEADKVIINQSYKYTFEVLDSEKSLIDFQSGSQKILKTLFKKKRGKKKKWYKSLKKFFKKVEKGVGKKVAVDLEP